MTVPTAGSFYCALDAFLTATPAPHPAIVHTLIAFLVTPTSPVQNTCLIPTIEETECRLDLIRKLRKNLGEAMIDWQPTAVQVSALLLMPMQALRERVDETAAGDDQCLAIYRKLMEIRDALRYFFQGKHPQAARRTRQTPGNTGPEAIEGASEPGNPSISRSQAEKRKDRDGHKCVFTGAALPDVCHIVPFALNSCKRNIETTTLLFSNYLRLFFPAADAPGLRILLQGLGCTDKAWNMLCLGPELHRYWAQPYWGAQCVGITPADDGSARQRLTIRLHWMRFRADDPNRPIDITTAATAHALLAELADMSAADRDRGDGRSSGVSGGACPGVQGLVAAHHHGSNHALISGQEVDVVLDSADDAVLMKRMLDIQWALVSVAAMSGAASPHDDNNDKDDDAMSELDCVRAKYELQAWLYADENDD